MNSKWPLVSLGEVLHHISRPINVKLDGKYREIGIRSHGKGVFHKEPVSGFDLGNKRVFRVEPGDFVLNIVFAWEGAVAVLSEAEGGMIGSHRFPTFRTDETRLDPYYLLAYFRTREGLDLLGRVSPGGAGRNRTLSRTAFLLQQIPLPPIAEQRRMVARLEEIRLQVSEAQQLRRESLEETKALVQAQARSVLSELREELTPLESWLHPIRDGIQTGPFGAQLSNGDFTDSGVPLLTIGNIQYDGLKCNDLKYVSTDKADQLSRYRVMEGDILFARMGTVGRCCVTPKKAVGWLINYHIIRVAIDTSRADPRFIHWTIRASADVERYLGERSRGATRQGVNSAIVAELPCRVPSLSKQHRIIADLDALQAEVSGMRRLQAEVALSIDGLFPAVLSKAFAGEL